MTLAAMEKLLIRDALRRHKGNRAAAARELGVDVSTLFRKLKALGLTRAIVRPFKVAPFCQRPEWSDAFRHGDSVSAWQIATVLPVSR